jgi:hypothetical protein
MRSALLAGFAVLLAILTGVTGCDSSKSQKQTATAQSKPKDPVQYTGREAFERMTGLATKWAPDAQPVRLESSLTPETTGQGGKSTLWRGFFASPSRRSLKSFTCSGSRLPDAPPVGVTVDAGENRYTPDVASLAFSPFLFKVDSDKAYGVAQEHGGQALTAKDNKQVVTYLLLHDKKKNVPVWYVIYGIGGNDRKGIALINATTGDFIGAGK